VSRTANINLKRTEQQGAAMEATRYAPERLYQSLALGYETVDELPVVLRDFYSDEMDGPWEAEEVARKAQLDILQATSVTYRYGDYRGTAYLIGRERTLYIELSKQERRQLRIIHAGGRYNLFKLSVKKVANMIMPPPAKNNTNNMSLELPEKKSDSG
jgi:hypothetical protein